MLLPPGNRIRTGGLVYSSDGLVLLFYSVDVLAADSQRNYLRQLRPSFETLAPVLYDTIAWMGFDGRIFDTKSFCNF